MIKKVRAFFEDHKKVIIIAFSFLAIATISFLSLSLLFGKKKLSEAEQVALNNFNDKVLPYLETIDTDGNIYNPTREEALIAFAVQYAYGENHQTELSNDDINQIIKEYFETEIDFDSFDQLRASMFLAEQGITYYSDKNHYVLEQKEKSKKELIQTPVTAYIQKDAIIKKNTITVTYSKYIANEPYAIFTDAALAQKDTSGCGDYFAGKGNVNAIKKLITAENSEYQKDFTLSLIVKDGKLVANY